MPSPGSRRLLRRGLVAVAVLLLAIGGTVAVLLLHSPGNVSHPDLSFTRSTVTQPPPKKPVVVNNFEWPRYGFNAERTRVLEGSGKLEPPLRVGWAYNDFALLEFPPVIYQDTLYLVDDNGSAKAIERRNGRVIWARRVGSLAAASPAIGVRERLVFVPLLSRTPHSHVPGNGSIVALSMRNGRVVWSRPLPPGSESSPLVWGPTVYFGDQAGTMYSLRAR